MDSPLAKHSLLKVVVVDDYDKENVPPFAVAKPTAARRKRVLDQDRVLRDITRQSTAPEALAQRALWGSQKPTVCRV